MQERNREVHQKGGKVKLNGDLKEVVKEFKYLGSSFTLDGKLEKEVSNKIPAANGFF